MGEGEIKAVATSGHLGTVCNNLAQVMWAKTRIQGKYHLPARNDHTEVRGTAFHH